MSDEARQKMQIRVQRISPCCSKPMFIGKYSEGGFVKVCCEGCGAQETLSAHHFEKAVADLGLPCESCGQTMHANTNIDGYKNYGLRCTCGKGILLANIVPDLPR